MTMIMIDGTHNAVPHIPASAPKVAGYVTGTPDVAWTPADFARFPAAGHVRINQGYPSPQIGPHSYDALNVEPPNSVLPSQVPALVRQRIVNGIEWTTVYAQCSESQSSTDVLAQVRAELEIAGAQYGRGWYYGHVNAWAAVAGWASEAQAAALLGKQLHGITCVAAQWATPGSNPGTLVPGTSVTLAAANVDLSVTADSWFPPPAPPAPAVQRGFLVTTGLAVPFAGRAVSSADGGKTWR